jgi:hypothetical protein
MVVSQNASTEFLRRHRKRDGVAVDRGGEPPGHVREVASCTAATLDG